MKFSFKDIKIIPLIYIAFVLCTTGLPLYVSGYFFMKPIDYIPEGSRLSFLKETKQDKNGSRYAIYNCVCGTHKEIRVTHVKTGKIKSCGCFKIELANKRFKTVAFDELRVLNNLTHGLSKHPLYNIYNDMIKRCENKNCREYPYYGGRGVMICIEWRQHFKCFYDWCIGNGWHKGLHLDKDKIPSKLGIPAIIYSPEMCSLITRKENMNYMSSNRVEAAFGKKQTLSQWADEFNFEYKYLWRRLNIGWDLERALTQPIKRLNWKNKNK